MWHLIKSKQSKVTKSNCSTGATSISKHQCKQLCLNPQAQFLRQSPLHAYNRCTFATLWVSLYWIIGNKNNKCIIIKCVPKFYINNFIYNYANTFAMIFLVESNGEQRFSVNWSSMQN